MEPSATPSRARGIAWQVIDGELVMLVVNSDELVGINATGEAIWELIDGTRTVESIAAEVAILYDLDDATASTEETVAFLEELQALGAVELVT